MGAAMWLYPGTGAPPAFSYSTASASPDIDPSGRARFAVHSSRRNSSFWTDKIFSLDSSAMPTWEHQAAADAQKSASVDQHTAHAGQAAR